MIILHTVFIKPASKLFMMTFATYVLIDICIFSGHCQGFSWFFTEFPVQYKLHIKKGTLVILCTQVWLQLCCVLIFYIMGGGGRFPCSCVECCCVEVLLWERGLHTSPPPPPHCRYPGWMLGGGGIVT
jgi:hypothetical protein